MTSFYPLKKIFVGLALSFGLCAMTVLGQTQQTTNTPPASADAKLAQPTNPAAATSKPMVTPLVHSVREIDLGMSTDDVKKKLGKPEVQDDTGMYFTLSGGDSVQIGLDAKKQVRTVAAIYAAGSKEAPSLKDVFGPSAEDKDGDVYKMERYPDAGYWVSYSRSNSQDKPIVVVTIKKMSAQ